jgi:hypothetical protein
MESPEWDMASPSAQGCPVQFDVWEVQKKRPTPADQAGGEVGRGSGLHRILRWLTAVPGTHF